MKNVKDKIRQIRIFEKYRKRIIIGLLNLKFETEV